MWMESNITLPWRCDIGGRVRGLLVKFSCANSWEKAHVKFASKKTKPPLSIAEENLLVLDNYEFNASTETEVSFLDGGVENVLYATILFTSSHNPLFHYSHHVFR